MGARDGVGVSVFDCPPFLALRSTSRGALLCYAVRWGGGVGCCRLADGGRLSLFLHVSRRGRWGLLRCFSPRRVGGGSVDY